MTFRHACVGAALVGALTLAPQAGGDRATVAAQHARPVNPCQLTGTHVSGVVSVDLRDGRHAELLLVDVSATVSMAPSLADVMVHVTAPLTFSGRFVTRDLGGPAAYLRRTYRAPHGGVRLDGNVPFEITLSSDPSHARARLPSPFGDGVISIPVPCSALHAGAPRTDMRTPPAEAHPRYVQLAPGTTVLSGAGTGHELARIERSDSSRAPVTFIGTVGETRSGFTRVSLRGGPIHIDGFVPAGSGAALDPAVDPADYAALYSPTLEVVSTLRRVRLPAGTPVYASPSAEHSWTNLTAPLDVYLRAADGPRSAIVLAAEQLAIHPCRFDGVAGRPPCGGARDLPPLSLRACTADGCTDVAYVNPTAD
ncbi:MAG: hypothetical protein R3B40_07325 [Polyangiales bacterium]